MWVPHPLHGDSYLLQHCCCQAEKKAASQLCKAIQNYHCRHSLILPLLFPLSCLLLARNISKLFQSWDENGPLHRNSLGFQPRFLQQLHKPHPVRLCGARFQGEVLPVHPVDLWRGLHWGVNAGQPEQQEEVQVCLGSRSPKALSGHGSAWAPLQGSFLSLFSLSSSLFSSLFFPADLSQHPIFSWQPFVNVTESVTLLTGLPLFSLLSSVLQPWEQPLSPAGSPCRHLSLHHHWVHPQGIPKWQVSCWEDVFSALGRLTWQPVFAGMQKFWGSTRGQNWMQACWQHAQLALQLTKRMEGRAAS